MPENAPPGWYQAETDAPGTERYWTGTEWSADTRSAMAPPPQASAGAPGDRMTPHGRTLASPWARIGARLLDGIIVGIVTAPLVFSEVDFGATSNAFGTGSFSSTKLIIAALIGIAYEVGMTALKGATLGKMAVGVEIVRQSDGQTPLGFGTAAQRWLPNAVGLLPGALSGLSGLIGLASLIMVFADDMRRSVYDFVGQTYVVQKVR
ncbi:MAG: RDD family protein [bacterium]|nr:RDD family protein [bacterium]